MELSERVQQPSIIHSPVPHSLPTAQLGGFFNHGQLSWSISNGNLCITNTTSGQCVQRWSPTNSGYEVKLVSEIKGPQNSLLVVAMEGCGQHIVGVLSSNWGKLIRGVSVPNRISAIHPFNFDGFSWNTSQFSRPDIFPLSVLSSFNGVVAVGTINGHVYLIDVQLGVGVANPINDCLNTPSPMHIIEGQVTERDLASMSNSGHVTVEISRGNFHKGKFKYQNVLFPTSSVLVTALCFAPQISGLFVGYSFGGFQLYDLSSFQLLHSSVLPPSSIFPPVTHFTYVEPENDPRNFVYVWVVRGKSRVLEESVVALASLYQMVFSEKTTPTSGHTLYHKFRGCGLRFEHVLSDSPASIVVPPGTQVLQCGTLVRYRREQPAHTLELDLSLTVFVWTVPSRLSPSEGGRTDVFVALFDVNQWYHSQMPRALRWKSKGMHTGVFGCSYFAFYNLASALPNDGSNIMDVLVDQLLPFQSHPPMPETFMWPSALKFDVKILTESSLAAGQCLGAQRMVLQKLDECRGSLFAQPEQLFRQCAHAELLPPACDHTQSGDLSSQRAALLSVAVTHTAPTRVLTAFADSWAGSGGDDPVISQWVMSTKNELEQAKKSMFSKCFGDSHLPPSTHWKKMAAIEVFLERLLSRGFERVGKTGPVFEAVSQLYLTVAKHKKVMEAMRFLNEQGLASDYPAAALRRRYDMLRGGTDSLTKLAIDCLIEDHHGNSEDSSPYYPPPSLPDFMNFLLTFDPLILHCLVVYLLCDLGSLYSPRLSPHTLYAPAQELPNSLVNTVHSLWLVDNTKFKDPAYDRDITVLFKKTASPPLFPWQHGVMVERLMRCGEVGVALSYVQTHGQEMQGLEEVKLKLGVFVGNGLISAAYEILKQFEGSEDYDDLFTFFLECCVEGKCLHSLLDLPLSSLAETTFVLYLEQHSVLTCREFLVFYFLLRHRFVEAMAMQEKIRPFAKTDPDPSTMERCNERDTLIAGLASVVPSSLHHVKLTAHSGRGQNSKVRVQVDKSLSAVVAKAVRSGSVSGGGGAVYNLIQSIAEKRSVPGGAFTPMRPSKGSVTELSHTPFLSTPLSVKRIRAPLTASRTCPLLTPTPRSRPMTPCGSGTHQQFVSHIQGFKNRMASLLSQSDGTAMDISTLQTPSPMSAMKLIRPIVTTPTSILKGTRSGAKSTDRRIRFAVDGSPSPEKERRPLLTPSVPSSLSTTASVAMTPLPPSSDDDDDDLYESPVESPSQLHSPTPSQTSAHSSPPPAQLKFDDIESSTSAEEVGVVKSIAMETNNEGSIGTATAGNDQEEYESSVVEPDIADDEESRSSQEESEDGPGSQATKSSPLGDMKLARDSLASNVSQTHTLVTLATKPTPASSGSIFTSSFSPVTSKESRTPRAVSGLFARVSTATATPVSQLFSPVPYLSDLMQAKKEKVQSSSVEFLKQQKHSKTRTPKPPPTVRVGQSFSSTMVPNVGISSSSPYSFTPPKQVPIKAHYHSPVEESEPMSFAFSPPLTRSAARRQREESMSREPSVEPSVSTPSTPETTTTTTKRKMRGRPRKNPLPPSDEVISLVTPPTLPRPLSKTRARVKPVKSGVGSRRSARLLRGKK